jgi:hypothetical protein
MINLKAVVTPVLATILSLGGGTPICSQTQSTDPVTVAVLEDYPAFRRAADQPRASARELKAIILRRNPVGAGGSVILLNPAYLDAATLNDALEVLGSCDDNSKQPPMNLVVIRATQHARPLPSARASTLGSHIAELQNQPESRLRALDGSGRAITIHTSVCAGPDTSRLPNRSGQGR